jgi:hypothetical protein
MRLTLLLLNKYLFVLLVFIFTTYTRASEPKNYALIIGISGYPKYAPQERLRFGDVDARAFADFVRTREGGSFPEVNIRLLINEEATHTNISEALNWLSKRIGGDDLVYIFFSGHGATDEIGHTYFMPYDADPPITRCTWIARRSIPRRRQGTVECTADYLFCRCMSCWRSAE